MEVQSRLDIPAGARLEMQPGGYHLMLVEPVARMERGMRVEVTLEFDDRSALTHAVEVRSHHGVGPHHHQH
jgi:periplasmic copper chaperone A